MNFNAFLWQTFTESNKGKESLDLFNNLRKYYDKKDAKLQNFLEQWICSGTLERTSSFVDHVEHIVEYTDILENALKDKLLPGLEMTTWEHAEEFFVAIADLCYASDKSDNSNENDREFVFETTDIPELSIALCFICPEFFFPYYFYPQFYLLTKIFNDFGIFLPPVPPKKDYDGRFAYYLELCQSVYQFRQVHRISGRNFPAFLYGFAPNFLENLTVQALPKPRKAWFVGGGINNNGDFQYLDQVTATSNTIWQGNSETQPGDIIVLYCLSPRSYVHSIWTALRPGATEPFRYFYNTIWMGNPNLVPPIHLDDIKKDPILSQMPLVKGNMQGINGRQIKKEQYERIVQILTQKGMDVSELPRLEDIEIGSVVLTNERDVENHLLEPLLLQLGFANEDWVRQMRLRVGRGEKIIPDYVIFPSTQAGSGSWVWEAKFSIQSHRQLQKDFEQGRSYAKLLGAEGVSLISKEGVWVSQKQDDYHLNKAKHWSIVQLQQSDFLNELRDLAAKNRLLSTRHFGGGYRKNIEAEKGIV